MARLKGTVLDEVDQVRLKAENDFYFFCQEVVGLPHLYELIHRRVCEYIAGIERLQSAGSETQYTNLLIPRGHFKSTIANICYVIWRLAKNSNLRINIAHGKATQAAKFMRGIKTHLETNPKFNLLWPDVFYAEPKRESPVWHSDEFTVKRSWEDPVASVTSSSTSASVVGSHFHLIIQDDLVYKETVLTAEQRQKTKEYRAESEYTWRGMGSHTLNIGTRWHYDDAHQELIDGAANIGDYRGRVRSLVLGVWDGREEDDHILFPAVTVNGETKGFTRKWLELKQASKPYEFAAQYLNDPSQRADRIFDESDFEWYIPGDDGFPLPLQGKEYRVFTAIDPNRTEKTSSDYCVILTAAIDEDGHVWVLDIYRGHPAGQQIVERVRAAAKRWNPKWVAVEVNNFQYQLKHWLRQDQADSGVHYNILEVERTRANRKYERITAMEPLVKARALHLIRGDETHMELVRELVNFGAWKNDDIADALADIYQYGRKSKPKKKAPEKIVYDPHLMDHILQEFGVTSGRVPKELGVRRIDRVGWR